MAHLLLIDGPSIFHIAYHTRPPFEFEGQPIGALKGYCDTLWRYLKSGMFEGVTHCAVAFEGKRNFRRALSPAYKANRKEQPIELTSQVRLIKQATLALGVPVLEESGFEADDMIGTYARIAQRIPAKVTIVSRDKDLFQLIDGHTFQFEPVSKAMFNRQTVFEKFGVDPTLMVDLLSLMGDTVDGVAGCPGVGPKKAAVLLREYGTLDRLLARLEVVQSSRLESLVFEHAEAVRLARELVRIDRYAPEPVTVEDLALNLDDYRFAAFLRGWGINWLATIAEAER